MQFRNLKKIFVFSVFQLLNLKNWVEWEFILLKKAAPSFSFFHSLLFFYSILHSHHPPFYFCTKIHLFVHDMLPGDTVLLCALGGTKLSNLEKRKGGKEHKIYMYFFFFFTSPFFSVTSVISSFIFKFRYFFSSSRFILFIQKAVEEQCRRRLCASPQKSTLLFCFETFNNFKEEKYISSSSSLPSPLFFHHSSIQ